MRVERKSEGLTIEAEGEEETTRLGRALAGEARPGTVIGLVGPLGAGKTRVARAVSEALGVNPGAIASPTFVLIHEYDGIFPVYHFDAYRLAGPGDFDALGAAEYLGGDGVCLVEWADRVAERLPAGSWWVRIEPIGPTARRFHLECPADPGLAGRMASRLSDAG